MILHKTSFFFSNGVCETETPSDCMEIDGKARLTVCLSFTSHPPRLSPKLLKIYEPFKAEVCWDIGILRKVGKILRKAEGKI